MQIFGAILIVGAFCAFCGYTWVKLDKEVHFAWDRYEDKDLILKKLEEYATYSEKKPNPHNSIVYMIVNFNTTFEQDLERIYTLRELGYWAYVMIYDKAHCEQKYKDLQRWVNNRFIFSRCERFEDYNKKQDGNNRQSALLF